MDMVLTCGVDLTPKIANLPARADNEEQPGLLHVRSCVGDLARVASAPCEAQAKFLRTRKRELQELIGAF